MLLGSAAPRHDILTVWSPPPVASVHNSQMMSAGNRLQIHGILILGRCCIILGQA